MNKETCLTSWGVSLGTVDRELQGRIHYFSGKNVAGKKNDFLSYAGGIQRKIRS
jgi:hypothetical protein